MRAVPLAALLGALVGCSSPPAVAPAPPAPPETRPLDAAAAPVATSLVDAGAPAPARHDTIVLVTDRAALAVLEARLTFATQVPAWPSIARVLAADVRAAGKADPAAGVSVRGHSHRLFDVRWLTEAPTGEVPPVQLKLAGVANRLDRTPLGGCGDVRLIYRLGYATSRLPMTVNVIYPVADDGAGCRTVATSWQPVAGLDPAAQARWLLRDGALASLGEPSMVQVNLQRVRWPSAVRPDLGGHAEYLLRSFERRGDTYVPVAVDNVPDVARIRRDRSLRAQLLAWIRDPATLARLDQGWALLPASLRADHAISVAPRGFARRANRPFRQLLAPSDLADVSFAGLSHVRSLEALLRRLDESGCAGCHQARTIAGFHLLGEDAPEELAANALAVPISGHLVDEVTRRTALVEALAAGMTPDFFRPFAERGSDGDAGWGARCGLGDAGFATWTCAPGLTCDPGDAPADDDAVGVCRPTSPEVGDMCEPGPITPHADPHKDRLARRTERACADNQVCNETAVGFPGGMCTAVCEPLPAGASCGAIAVLAPFNACLARREPFATCLTRNVRPAGLRSCDVTRPCREDYVCVRGGTGGVCIPPYFLFQLRVDGHDG